MKSNEHWASLEAPAARLGRARKRIRPQSQRDMYIEVDLASRERMFTFGCPWNGSVHRPTWEPTASLGCVARVTDAGDRLELSVVLKDADLSAVFDTVVDSLAEVVDLAPSDDLALNEFVNRLAHWQTLFEGIGRAGLGDTHRRGLVGELLVLRDLVLPSLDAEAAISGWTGPLRANQDFQTDVLAIEVKCTSALHPAAFTVNNERELDAGGATALVLAHVTLDERRGEGFTLPQLVEDVLLSLSSSPSARALFEERLERLGYLDAQAGLYDEPHYAVRDLRFFHVLEGFPRITENQLNDGVGQVEYRVTLAACAPFATTTENVEAMIRGSGRHV